MSVFLIILGVLLFAGAIGLLFKQQMLSPIASWAGLTCIWLSETLPLNSTIIVGWLGMTLLVMAATWLQPDAIKQQTKGVGYMTIGGITGMSIGILGYSLTNSLSLLYGIMIAATAFGVCLGYMLFTNTPQGQKVNIRSGYFLTYLSAKGFPFGITIMQIGITLVLMLAISNSY